MPLNVTGHGIEVGFNKALIEYADKDDPLLLNSLISASSDAISSEILARTLSIILSEYSDHHSKILDFLIKSHFSLLEKDPRDTFVGEDFLSRLIYE